MHPFIEHEINLTRRQFFGNVGLRFGGLALAQLMGQQAFAAATTKASGPVHPALAGFPHFPAKAKRLIYLHMNGAPSQLDLWDYKPGLQEFFDKELPASVRNNQRLSTMPSGQSRFPVAPSKYKFTQEGKCKRWVNAQLLPHTAKIVDEI